MISAITNALRGKDDFHFGRWGTFWHRFSIAPWRWTMALLKFEDHWSLHFFCLWIKLCESRSGPEDMLDKWGWYYCQDWPSLVLDWGPKRSLRITMPWAWDHCVGETMLEDGSFVEYGRYTKGMPLERNPDPPFMYRTIQPYMYMLRSGEVQVRTAEVTVSRSTHYWTNSFFHWLRWPSRTRTFIDVKFSDEVGEETGSWKGGCTGCGYEMKPGETPVQCLERMMHERKF